jgi:hypothetical protein
MSSKPKASEYKATEQEKVSASVSKAEKDYFDQKYRPLLVEMGKQAEQEDIGALAAGRASADVQQALTSQPTLAGVSSIDQAADRAVASVAQIQQGRGQGLAAQKNRQVGVLGAARGQAADATTGLAKAARIASTKQLQQAAAKQSVRNTRFKLGAKILEKGGENFQQNQALEKAGITDERNLFQKIFIEPGGVFDTTDYGSIGG